MWLFIVLSLPNVLHNRKQLDLHHLPIPDAQFE